MKHLISLVLGLMLTATTVAVAQPYTHADSSYFEQFREKTFDQITSRVWAQVLILNQKRYANPNLVLPGDTIRLPLEKQYIAQAEPRGRDHMWEASVRFGNDVIWPYLMGQMAAPTDTGAVKEPSSSATTQRVPDVLWLVIIALFALIALFLWLNRKKQPVRKEERPDDFPPFVHNPPTPGTPESIIRGTAQEALSRVYGRNFTIVPGSIEEGVINGPQTQFFADMTPRTENFNNEPGFRARLRFGDGKERLVVSRWACFNPCWSAVNAKFKGTFTPKGGKPEDIPALSNVQAQNTVASIGIITVGRKLPRWPIESMIPAAAEVKPAAVESPVPTAASEQPTRSGVVARLTELSVSRTGGLTMKAAPNTTIDFSFNEIAELSVIATGNPRPKPEASATDEKTS